jgi:hypothetical protein
MIRGDAMVGIEAIGRLKGVVRRLAELPRKVAEEAKPGLDRLLREEFVNGTDPYGRAWAPLKPSTIARGRRPPPLDDTGTLKRGTTVELQRGRTPGLLLKTGAVYGYFHQMGFRIGTTKVPPRRVLPQYGLPAGWKIVLREAARRVALRAVRG